MGAKQLSVGKTGKMVDGHPHTVWEVLELGKSEASEDVDGFPPQPGWVRVPGTAVFETREEAESAMKRLQNLPE